MEPRPLLGGGQSPCRAPPGDRGAWGCEACPVRSGGQCPCQAPPRSRSALSEAQRPSHTEYHLGAMECRDYRARFVRALGFMVAATRANRCTQRGVRTDARRPRRRIHALAGCAGTCAATGVPEDSKPKASSADMPSATHRHRSVPTLGAIRRRSRRPYTSIRGSICQCRRWEPSCESVWRRTFKTPCSKLQCRRR